MRTLLRCVLTLCATACWLVAHAGDDLSLQDRIERARFVREAAEQVSPSHPFAGAYAYSIVGGGSIYITANNEYAEVYAGCFGIDSIEIGHVVAGNDGSVTLVPKGKLAHAKRLYVVRWGDMRWLGNDHEGRDFVNWINAFGHGEGTMLPIAGYYRESSGTTRPGADFELPPDLAPFLREAAVEIRLTQLVEDPSALQWDNNMASIHAVTDSGRDDGLFPGMVLYSLDDGPNPGWTARVIDADDNKASLAIELIRFDPSEDADPPPPGTRFSSRAQQQDETMRRPVAASLVGLDESLDSVTWNDDNEAIMHGEIDRGSVDGIRTGMRLNPVDHHRRAYLKVESVENHRSRVKILVSRYSRDEKLGDTEKPVVGMRVKGELE